MILGAITMVETIHRMAMVVEIMDLTLANLESVREDVE